MFRAWLRDGETIHSGEALMLACLLHAKGNNRRGTEFKDVQRIMHDVNYTPTT
jgi:hypothetical protein